VFGSRRLTVPFVLRRLHPLFLARSPAAFYDSLVIKRC